MLINMLYKLQITTIFARIQYFSTILNTFLSKIDSKPSCASKFEPKKIMSERS